MKEQELIPHLFRIEFSRITAVLCSHFGMEYLEAAEDIAGETFLSALEIWPYKGVPANPSAWLYTVAKNKAINQLKRKNLFDRKITKNIANETPLNQDAVIDLSDQNIADSQLRMFFAICHPAIPAESQIGLALRILCGFGIEEIATAFLTNKETINKRLARAREKLRTEQVSIEFPGDDAINKRLKTVLLTVYLLFNEGYYSESDDAVLREDLCQEAMRLAYLLTENEKTNLPPVNALLSLFCFHASRFASRKNDHGEIILYYDQDDRLWNQDLISKGVYFLQQAAQGNHLSRYHIEASIAYWHTIKQDTAEKWENILQLYNQLLRIDYSPVAALNRTYALSKANGKTEAIQEAEKLRLIDNPYYHSLLGELYDGIDTDKAIAHFEAAITLTRSNTERAILSERMQSGIQKKRK